MTSTKRSLAALVLIFMAAILSIRPAKTAGDAVAVVWSEPARVYAGFDASMFETLTRERIDWNASSGFQIPEAAHAVGWLTLVYADRIEYAQVVRGRDSGDVYMIVTDSLREFVASYGGANTWHTRGMYRVSGAEWDAAVTALKMETGAQV